MEDAPRRPGLRKICTEILNRKGIRPAFCPGIQLGQPKADKITGRLGDCLRHASRFVAEPITLEPQCNNAVIMRPDGAELIQKWIVRSMICREGPNAPPAPHVRLHQTPDHPFGAVRPRDSAPE